MSKVILRKEIKKLYLNTVLKIFIRQYRTQAGNHGNCCFIAIFENVLKYLLFEVFFCLILSESFSPWSINIRCNDSDAKQWLQQLDDGRLKPSKTTCFWREIVAAANSLRPRETKREWSSSFSLAGNPKCTMTSCWMASLGFVYGLLLGNCGYQTIERFMTKPKSQFSAILAWYARCARDKIINSLRENEIIQDL